MIDNELRELWLACVRRRDLENAKRGATLIDNVLTLVSGEDRDAWHETAFAVRKHIRLLQEEEAQMCAPWFQVAPLRGDFGAQMGAAK